MGLGALNRVLLTANDLRDGNTAHLRPDDARARHIRTLLSGGSEKCTLRVAVEDEYLHDEAVCHVHSDGSCTLCLPTHGRRTSESEDTNVTLLLAMQRPKATARIIQAVAGVGVKRIVLIHGEKTERTYWQSRLLRAANDTQEADDGSDVQDISNAPKVRRLLIEGIQQGAQDNKLPQVLLDRRALPELARTYGNTGSRTLLFAHPRKVGDGRQEESVVANVARGAGEVVLAIGPEGGWSDDEVNKLVELGFDAVRFGERVLRSETAVVVAMALVHEGLRWRRRRWAEVDADV